MNQVDMSNTLPPESNVKPIQTSRLTRNQCLLLGATVAAALGIFVLLSKNIPLTASPLDPVSTHQSIPIDGPTEAEQPVPTPLTSAANIGASNASSSLDPAPAGNVHRLEGPSPQLTASTASAAPSDSAVQMAKPADEMATLTHSIEGLSTRVDNLADGIKQMQSHWESIHAYMDQTQKATRAPARKKASSAKNETVHSPQIVSVDSWGGQPSFVVQQGQAVRFVGDSDPYGAAMPKEKTRAE